MAILPGSPYRKHLHPEMFGLASGVELVGGGENTSHVCYNDLEAGMNGWCATCDHRNNNMVILSDIYRPRSLFICTIVPLFPCGGIHQGRFDLKQKTTYRRRSRISRIGISRTEIQYFLQKVKFGPRECRPYLFI